MHSAVTSVAEVENLKMTTWNSKEHSLSCFSFFNNCIIMYACISKYFFREICHKMSDRLDFIQFQQSISGWIYACSMLMINFQQLNYN